MADTMKRTRSAKGAAAVGKRPRARLKPDEVGLRREVIDAHLDEEHSLENLSKVAHFSLAQHLEARGAWREALAEYLEAPEVTRLRLYLETMGEVLPQVRDKVILDASTAEGAKVTPWCSA